MQKLEQALRQSSNESSGQCRVPPMMYDDPYEEPPTPSDMSSSFGVVSELSRLPACPASALNSFDSRGPGDGASARRDFPLSLPPSQDIDFDDGDQSSILLAASASRPVVPNPSLGNYDEPWDLFSKRRELEDQLRAMPNFAFKLPERPEATPPGRSQSASDERSFTDGYDRPWDLQPHRRDGRDDEGYEKPWDLKPHEKDLRVAVVGEYDAPWDIKPRSRVERELIAAKSAKDAAAGLHSASAAATPPLAAGLHSASAAAASPLAAGLHSASAAATPPLAAGLHSASAAATPPLAAKVSSSAEDSRPSIEYDAPWDQKKKLLMSKPVSEVKDCGPVPVAQPRVASAAGRPTSPVREKIDPKLPLEQQCWYHGSISRVDAEGLLRTHREGSYLVRTSESNRKDYSLSVKSSKGFMHMKIVTESIDGGGVRYILGQFSQPFASIPLMIHKYTVNKLPIKGAEHMCLLYPVSHELL